MRSHLAANSARNRAGIALLLVVIVMAMTVILALSFLSAQSTSIGISHNVERQATARMIAETALDLGISQIKTDPSWRTNRTSGVWVANQTYAGGTFTLKGEDGTVVNSQVVPGDGDLTNNPTDPVALTATGTYGGVVYVTHAQVKTTASNGSKVLLVAPDATSPGAQTLARKNLLVSWGYAVSMINDSASQGEYNTALASAASNTTNAAVYVASNCSAANVSTKLLPAALGVVCEQGVLANEFGITSADASSVPASSLSVTNNTHYITSPFSTGSLTITTTTQALWSYGGTLSLAADALGGASPGLIIIDSGGVLVGGSTYAAGRRVLMPWGGSTFDFTQLNSNGQTLLQRAVEWASVAGGSGGPINGGYQTAFPTAQKKMDGQQIATQITISKSGALTGITAFVDGPPPKLIRYALYTDVAGEPGVLVAQTATAQILSNSPYWHTLALNNVSVSAGTYWVALSFAHSNENYYYDTSAPGKYRAVSYDAVTNGFKSSWGTSTTSGIRRISIYTNLTPAGGSSGGGGSGDGGGSGGSSVTYTYQIVRGDQP